MGNLDLSPQNIWAAIGILCFIIEMVAPAFIMLFVGIGALVVASVLIFLPEWGLIAQLLLFAGATALSFLVLRPTLLRRYQSREAKGNYTEYEGELATVMHKPKTNGLMRIRFRGTEWDARPARDTTPMVAGQTVKVVRMDGTVAIVDVL